MKPMTQFEEIITLLDEDKTYWGFNEDCAIATYFTWSDGDRIGYMSEHTFYYDTLKDVLDPSDWEDVNCWTEATFGDAYHFRTYLDDFYTDQDEENLIEYTLGLVEACEEMSIEDAMKKIHKLIC